MGIFRSKFFYMCCFLFVALVAATIFFYFTDEGVANEFRQVRQPNPNLFHVGIDVSATIESDMLDDFKNNVISRLKNFIGDEAVSYYVSSFGNPGCGKASFSSIVSNQSPKDETAFEWDVQKKILSVSPARKPGPGRPLTTPLNCLLDQVLTDRIGGRVIIFSDLLNEESDCPTIPCPFPERAITKFGANKESQIVFLYPTPHDLKKKDQQNFIDKMQKLASEGRIRAFFYHIPDDPEKRSAFMKTQLQNSIPVTTFEIVQERVLKMVDAIVSAVRG